MAWFSLLLSFSWAFVSPTLDACWPGWRTPYQCEEPHLTVAAEYVGTQETGGANAGPEVERFLAAVGLNRGNPYCAAFVSFTLDQVATPPVTYPTVRTALATKFITRRSMDAREVLRGQKQPQPGDIVIWRKGNTVFGHAGLVTSWDGACGTTIEANTGNSTYGDQRDGDGVWRRERCVQPGNNFRIVAFTPVEY